MWHAITSRFVGDEEASGHALRRQRRWNALADRFPLPDMSVLDMGGTVESWRNCPRLPGRLVLLNTFAQQSAGEVIVGDACELPPALEGHHFDLVFSNSVIEHVGGHWRRQQFARSVRELGTHHWIQTPYRFFPIEPHFLCPCLQFLPLGIGAHVATHWPVGNYAGHLASATDAVPHLSGIELLSITQMREYFPDSTITTEQFGPLIKSITAVC